VLRHRKLLGNPVIAPGPLLQSRELFLFRARVEIVPGQQAVDESLVVEDVRQVQRDLGVG
jgi:hypothetical protein